jgi:biopolymer transport protein ExbB
MVPLLLIGLVAAGVTVWKIAALRKVKCPAPEALDRVARHLRADEVGEARALVGGMSAPFQSLLGAGIDYRAVRKDHLEEILHERALATIPLLDRHLGLLAVLGAVAPLLGLLGTVTGMIHTFEMVTVFGTGDAKLLSGGISEALVTTETGLVIAVPVLLVHAFLNRRVRDIVDNLEQTLIGFVNRLHAVDASES